MKTIWRGLSLAIFLIGIVSFSQVQQTRPPGQNTSGSPPLMEVPSRGQSNTTDTDDIEPVRPFIARYVESRVSRDGKRIIAARRTRYVNAKGEWREVVYDPRGDELTLEASRQTVVYAGDAEGVYGRGQASDSRSFVSPAADEKMLRFFRSHHSLRNDPKFVRTEVIAGVTAYVLRTEIRDPANTKEWVEESFSPVTGFNPLRTIIHLKDGSEVRLDAIGIEFRDVPQNLNDDLKALPLAPKDPKKQ